MKVVDARLSTGEPIIIREEWFVRAAENQSDWREVLPVMGDFGGGLQAKVNPKFIVWLRVMDFSK